jgi:galactokinase
VPPGSGLSSSAALELSVGLALLTIAGAHMTPVDLALACQQAEHQYAGVRCGIMDQFISALGRPGNALLIDCRSHEFSLVPIRMPDVDLVICDSGVTHSNAASEYNQRRAECEQGLSLLRRFSPDLKEGSALRDVTPLNLEQARESLPEVLYRRCRHVVSENVRTLEAAAALGSGDAESLGRLMCQSHRSLSEDYQVSCPELDLLVRMALEQPGVLGSRMTGGGFGGWTVNLVRKAEVENFKKVLTSRYEREMGHSPAILIVHASEGAREVIANRWSLH